MAILATSTNDPESLAEIANRLLNYEDFAYDFAETLKSAMGGNTTHQAIVASYFQPSERDLTSFGIPENEQVNYASCTELGSLILATAKQVAPFVFP